MDKSLIGAQARWFTAAALNGNPQYQFDSVAGRTILLFFAGSAGWAPVQQALQAVQRWRAVFDDDKACFFGISIDPADAEQGRIAQQVPGIRWFLDYDRAVSKAYGASQPIGEDQLQYRPHFVLLDHRMRIAGVYDLQEAEQALADTAAAAARGIEITHAPVLTVPHVFDAALCARLIAAYETNGGIESGFMREKDGKTVGVMDHNIKRRRDYLLDDPDLRQAVKQRLEQALLPEIARAFQFETSRIERWLVGCYDGTEGGFFLPHRDNTTRGTAHRVFACTINLNTADYTGGDLRFPEYGARTYRAPTGGAVIFSCSLLHEALPVTSGRRFAFVPFFFDEAHEEIRQRNRVHLAA